MFVIDLEEETVFGSLQICDIKSNHGKFHGCLFCNLISSLSMSLWFNKFTKETIYISASSFSVGFVSFIPNS